MPVSYQDPNEKKIVRHPLLKRMRSYYRAPRKSSVENLFYQKMYMDIHRIYIELELINTKIFNRIKSIIGAENSITHLIDTETSSTYYGAKYYDLAGESVAFFNAKANATPNTEDEITNLYNTNSIAAKLSNIYFKINQLERRVR